MKKMNLPSRGVIVHTPFSVSPSPRRRLSFLCLLAAFTLILPFLFSSEAAAAAKEEPKKSAQKAPAKANPPAKAKANDTSKGAPQKNAKAAPAAKTGPAKAYAKPAAKNSVSAKSSKSKPSRKRLFVRSMLPEEEKSSLRERGITSGFGPRSGSSKGKYVRLHKGIDVTAPMGAPVLAFNDGEIIFAGRDGGYGISIIVLQPDGRKARYAHMQKLLASQGETVVRGQKIGLVGRTGRTTGPHLHFELIEDDQAVDPAMHVWDSTELVLLPGDLDIRDLPDDDHLAAATARPATTAIR